ncbi:MetQ/NlpA family ABC transporter substrate-binding protein [Weissella soli]|jgi:D-methionine transport system substrate-binding protein|uniref:Lipoprotein n=3 Tax=Weissella soli TaxID=155866 RepID=A0A288Q6C5_9LACO|nr:MetQ/NlpA family ABC transporter substrate-binding protein [Weissella soli]AOT56467.1 putative D-methionine-binding lipoprotein MetQ [Weissella soli]MCT8395085.1 MetQ/NlpA family ABC transporter substrate-binding protein [Weissella soli]NKY82918.1 MetQ/NlpA family ABC transporter substrate-binding protein [Weissella soli]QEA34612.1 MetQ/NlpA family ABC transporter substrate-binding protein [Weissella soli]RDL12035.1 D-methionine transport system substrate-binding protein [Weissella soli]
MKKIQILAATAATVFTASTVVSTTTQVASAASKKTVTVGVVGDSDRQLWEYVVKDAKKKYGITIKLKEFTDYVQPNKAVADGSLDLNSFQTLNYFKTQNPEYKNKLATIGKTYITPIKLYSKTLTSLKDIKKGATIAIPNDASNEKRALDLLVSAKLIKYDTSKKTPTAKDITKNKKNLKIKEVESAQAAAALKSVDAAVVNTNYALDAKLTDKETLFTEPVNKKAAGYINYIVALKKDKNKKIYKQVVKAYQTDKTKKHIKALYGTAEKAAWDIKLK